MTLTSLPVLLYVIPAVMLLAALVPPRRKPAVLGLGGLAYQTMTGGAAGISLLVLSVCGAWLALRLIPVECSIQKARRRAAYGILFQIAVLVAARMLLPIAPMLPVLLCTMLAAETLTARASRKMYIPPLLAYIGAACAMPHLWAGPLMEFREMRAMTANRMVTAERIGKGATLCIRGLFQSVLIAMPMQTLLTELQTYSDQRTAADSWTMQIVWYLSVFFRLKGAVRFGEGLALMLGFSHPKSMTQPLGAASLREFWQRFSGSVCAWTERVLLQGVSGSGDYFSRMLVFLCAMGLLLGSGWCGALWGAVTALLLSLGRIQAFQEFAAQIPRPLRQLWTAFLVLLTSGLLRCKTLPELFRQAAELVGANGFAMSSTVRYLCGTHLIPLLFGLIGLLPVMPSIERKVAANRTAEAVVRYGRLPVQLGALLLCMAELLSQYLRS